MIIPVIDKECHSISREDMLSFTRRKRFFCWSNTHPPYAVNCHPETYFPLGAGVSSGHYVAILQPGEDWELHDDEYISTLDREAVFSGHSFENVYLLTS